MEEDFAFRSLYPAYAAWCRDDEQPELDPYELADLRYMQENGK